MAELPTTFDQLKTELLKTDFIKHCENPHKQRQPFGCSMYCFAILFNNNHFLELLETSETFHGMTREDENELLSNLADAHKEFPSMQISPLAFVNVGFGHLQRKLVADILDTNEKEFEQEQNAELVVPMWLSVKRRQKDEMIHRVLVVISNEFYYLIDPMFAYIYKFTSAEMFSEFYSTYYSVERLMIKSNGSWKYGFLNRSVNELNLF